MFNFLSSFLRAASATPLPLPPTPCNTLEGEDAGESAWDAWDIMAQSAMLVRLYAFAHEQEREEEAEQFAWLTEQYGTWVERFLIRVRRRAGLPPLP